MPRPATNSWRAASATDRPSPPGNLDAACTAPPTESLATRTTSGDACSAESLDAMPGRYDVANAEPMTATPSAAPTWRVVSFMAEPTPAFDGGSEPITDSVAGAI